MVQIQVERISSSTFTGFFYKHELTPEQQMLFPAGLSVIEIEGDYAIEADAIVVEWVFAVYGKVQLELNSDDFDMYEVLEQLEENAPQYECAI